MSTSRPDLGPSIGGRFLAALTVAALALVGLVVVPAAPAAAAPDSFSIAPDAGPTAGGTVVTVTAPAGRTFTSVSGSTAIGSDDKTYAWGLGNSGQLGNGTTPLVQSTPVEVTLPTGVTFTSVSSKVLHSLATGSDDKTYAWGSNSNGQLGDDSQTNRSTPVEVTLPTGVTFTSVSAGVSHSLAVGSDGKAYAWGSDDFGQLGNGAVTGNKLVPVEVSLPGGVTVSSVSAGANHSLAIGTNGKTYAWGLGQFGKLGNGSDASQPTPVEVTLPTGVTFTSVSAGANHSVALGTDGKTYAWGYGGLGRLGNGVTANEWAPVAVLLPADGEFTSVSAGTSHSLAVGSDGKAYAWGSDDEGRLGDGLPLEAQLMPVAVLLPPGVEFTSVSAGDEHSAAIGSNGKVYTWGRNNNGQLGNGLPNVNQPAPVLVTTPAVVVTSVTFDGVAGTGLVLDSGVWKVTTPAHVVGDVDVVLNWTLGGVIQTPLTLTDGFSYASVPDAPTAVSGTAGDEQVALSWTAPASNGGSAVSDYEIEFSDDDGSLWTPFADGVSTATSAAVTGLSNGTEYVFRVRAINAIGPGPWSDPSIGVTPLNPPPAPPTDVTVTGGMLQAFVSWTPASPPGPDPVEYTVTIVQGPDTFTCTTSDIPCVLTGLAPGAITANVVATTITGDSTPATGTGTVLGVEDAPETAPVDQGGATIEVQDSGGDVITEAAPGEVLTVIVGGFAPESLVHVFLYSTPELLASGLTDALGQASFAVTVPSDAALGDHTLVASGLNASGETATASVRIALASQGLGGTGGGDASGAIGFGVLLLLAGAGLVLWMRRRGLQREASAA